MNGYEYVEKIISKTNYDVGPLINLTDGFETDWLEFKAAICQQEGAPDTKTNKWDYRWNVSKALFAIANNIGGAVLIGVGEDSNHRAKLVSLEHSGFTGDKDEFMRKIEQTILNPEAGWKTTKGAWKCKESHHLFKPIWGRFNDQPVIIVLVKPRRNEDGWLQLEHIQNKVQRNVVLNRIPGDIGKVIEVEENDRAGWWDARDIDRPDLNGSYNSFLSDWEITGRHSEDVISDKVCSYIKTLKSQANRDKIDAFFTPLYAEEMLNDMAKFNPSAQTRGVLGLLDEKPSFVLLGDPGSGKSTCLHHKAFSVAREWKNGQPWTLIISLNEYTEAGLRSLILKQLPGLYWIDIEAKINSGEIILFLDALNECPTEHYEDCYQQIHGMLRDCPSARIVISSRLSHNPHFNLPTFGIRPMDRQQQQNFLESYIENSAKSAEILEKLNRQPGTKHIASSPVLLKMVADVVIDGGDFSNGIAELYHCSLKAWHRRESEKNKQNGAPPLWPFNTVREALAELSFCMRAEGKVSCSVSFARKSLARVLSVDVVPRFLDRIAQGLLLKVDENEEFLHFSHETIQEYLVAEYLATDPGALQGLLKDVSEKTISNWAMPLVFAFELIKDPPKDFLLSAWRAEPMLVAAALRNSKRLASLPLHEHSDLWLRGALRAMRGEDPTPDTLEISYVSHLPPKYLLPEALIAALRGTPFWYSAHSHSEGKVRLERLQGLIFDRSTIWIELIPYIGSELLTWGKNISPAQKVLIGESTAKDINLSLETTTVAELCALLRLKKISKSDFISNWESALEQSDNSQIYMDLIALLRTNAKLGDDQIRFSKFNNGHKSHLKNIGENWNLSFRLLNILVREGIITVDDVRNDAGRLDDIISRTSPMNAYRFLKYGIINQNDIPKDRLKELIGGMKSKFSTELKNKGLISKDDKLASRREKTYSIKDLVSKEIREQIDTEIRFQQWDVTVYKIVPDKKFGFVRHPRFNEEAFFLLSDIVNPNNKTINEGDTLCVFLKTQFNNTRNEWGFAVIPGGTLRKISKVN